MKLSQWQAATTAQRRAWLRVGELIEPSPEAIQWALGMLNDAQEADSKEQVVEGATKDEIDGALTSIMRATVIEIVLLAKDSEDAAMYRYVSPCRIRGTQDSPASGDAANTTGT